VPEPIERLDRLDHRPLVDLHAHVLPGVDDGARDDDEALGMLRIAAADGIHTIVAAPHAHHAGAARVLEGVARLSRLAVDAGIAVRVVPGHEARIGADLAGRYASGELLTINGTRWLLVECYLFDDWPMHLIERALDRVSTAGLRPVLAHAERYGFVQRDPASLVPLIERGIPVQINAGSLALRDVATERVTAERLLKKRLAHLITSDAHNLRYRPPAIRAALTRAAAITSTAYAAWMADTAERIVAGDDVDLPCP
jgi:protein-tyrosine phosphatase